jgi:ATPases involved in chromosome partitioning
MQKKHNPYTGKIIAVAITKGGVGKSSMSMNIAPDVNPDYYYDTDTTPAVSTFNSFRPEASRWNVLRVKSGDSADKFAADILEAKEQGKTVLIDCGGFDSAFTRIAVAAADIILSPFNDDPTDMLGVQVFSDALNDISREMGTKITAHLVMYKVHPSRTNFRYVDEHLAQFDNLRRLPTAIPTDKSVPEKFGEGLGVVEQLTTRHGRAGTAFRSLFEDIRKALNDVQK